MSLQLSSSCLSARLQTQSALGPRTILDRGGWGRPEEGNAGLSANTIMCRLNNQWKENKRRGHICTPSLVMAHG